MAIITDSEINTGDTARKAFYFICTVRGASELCVEVM